MQLRIHEHLQKGQERSIRTFEHFLGHFFAKYLPVMSEWEMEVWLVENDPDDTDEMTNEGTLPRFKCGIVLQRPGCDNIYTQKMSSNLSGAIFYAIKSVHRDVVKHSSQCDQAERSNISEAR